MLHSLIPCDIQHTCSQEKPKQCLVSEKYYCRRFVFSLSFTLSRHLFLLNEPHNFQLFSVILLFKFINSINFLHFFSHPTFISNNYWTFSDGAEEKDEEEKKIRFPCDVLVKNNFSNIALMRVYVVNKLLEMNSLRFYKRYLSKNK